MSDTPYGKIITSLANLAKLRCDDDEHIRRSPVMDEVVRIRSNADLLERENAGLRAKLEEAQRDAGRYRWLQVHTDSMALDPPLTVARVCGWGLDAWSGDNLSAAIDAAIAKEKP